MKIAIEARALSMRGGVHTYVVQLLRHLPSLTQADEVAVISDKVLPLRRPLLLPWWMNVSLPRYLARVRPDVAHFTKAAIPTRKVAPTVVTIYDIIPLLLPQTQSFARRLWWPAALRQAAKHSDHILTISQASKQDMVRLLGVDSHTITVTPLAVDVRRFRPDLPRQDMMSTLGRLGLDKPYILFVGTRDARKNIASLLDAYGRIAGDVPHQLVIAGAQAAKEDDSYRRVVSAREGRVHVLDYVDQKDLPALYAGADVFVWPSMYEGWGLPPQEAMASGVPVIVSDGGSLPEVVGEAGEVVPFSTPVVGDRLHDVDFTKRLARAMGTILADPLKRREMAAAGIRQVARFSWNEVAKKTYEVYTKVVQMYAQ